MLCNSEKPMGEHSFMGKSIGQSITITNGVYMIWGITLLLITLKLGGVLTAPWVLVFLPMIAMSGFIVLSLAGIGLNTLYEEELAEEEKQDERI